MVAAGLALSLAGLLFYERTLFGCLFGALFLPAAVCTRLSPRELLRVVRPGGLVFISYTAWSSPWGGHETSPWHFLGGEYAARRYERTVGRPPKNRYGETMFPTRVADGLRWARSQPDAWLIEAAPRYHPDWATFVVDLPGVREVATWNLMMVLRRR